MSKNARFRVGDEAVLTMYGVSEDVTIVGVYTAYADVLYKVKVHNPEAERQERMAFEDELERWNDDGGGPR